MISFLGIRPFTQYKWNNPKLYGKTIGIKQKQNTAKCDLYV